ncbi:hypothetical protein [Streptomyces virginiae]|uniref:hypothetical protein n=1 Tax=Streptomyces virginiae TaxID=1961 RepID=UPI0036FDB836
MADLARSTLARLTAAEQVPGAGRRWTPALAREFLGRHSGRPPRTPTATSSAAAPSLGSLGLDGLRAEPERL